MRSAPEPARCWSAPVKASNGFSPWIDFGDGGAIADDDPVEQAKTAKSNALLTNAVVFHNAALDIAEIVRVGRKMATPSTPRTWPPSRRT
ncbi:Tn3 family transposase [Streptomyces sp. G-G2]|uniref:Tn3 family transposase n=1 Tax=Streptomyces sp. G-G2 TaxID=3046201 RepID=UPI0024B92AFB|nr:Tn3 family transposase [Streptomyces sp. G-G2]MDJ0382335.1 Tn3 family transposase [Streptomyces sp. G-G2]